MNVAQTAALVAVIAILVGIVYELHVLRAECVKIREHLAAQHALLDVDVEQPKMTARTGSTSKTKKPTKLIPPGQRKGISR